MFSNRRDGVGLTIACCDDTRHISVFPGEFGQGGGGAVQAVSIGVAINCISVVGFKRLRIRVGGGVLSAKAETGRKVSSILSASTMLSRRWEWVLMEKILLKKVKKKMPPGLSVRRNSG